MFVENKAKVNSKLTLLMTQGKHYSTNWKPFLPRGKTNNWIQLTHFFITATRINDGKTFLGKIKAMFTCNDVPLFILCEY